MSILLLQVQIVSDFFSTQMKKFIDISDKNNNMCNPNFLTEDF